MLTNKQYQVLLDLYHEYHEAFLMLSDEIKKAFYDRLYGRI